MAIRKYRLKSGTHFLRNPDTHELIEPALEPGAILELDDKYAAGIMDKLEPVLTDNATLAEAAVEVRKPVLDAGAKDDPHMKGKHQSE